MRKTFFHRLGLGLILIFLLLLTTAVQAAGEPRAEVIDNFEDYNTSAKLKAVWTVYEGAPVISLSDVAHAGSRSMRMDYDVSNGPMTNWVSMELPDGTNLSKMATFSVWYQGLETNSTDSLSMQILSETNEVLFQDNLSGAVANCGWNRWDTNLKGILDTAHTIVIGVEASIGDIPGTGTIYLDDVSVTNGVHTVWLGHSSDWHDPANWNRGVPTELTDARIPNMPGGGLMPTIKNGSATAHDLIVTRKALLDLGSGSLDLTGTLLNSGTVFRTKTVGGSQEKSFLLEGGHPGILISTKPPPGADPTNSSSELGDTSVAVVGRTCDGGGGSVERCYSISPANHEPSTITFFFDQSDLVNQVCEDLALFEFSRNRWQEVASPGDPNITHQCEMANFSVTVSGITNYTPFLLSDAVPVAISLQDLNASSPVSFSPAIIAAGLLVLSALVLLRRRS